MLPAVGSELQRTPNADRSDGRSVFARPQNTADALDGNVGDVARRARPEER